MKDKKFYCLLLNIGEVTSDKFTLVRDVLRRDYNHFPIDELKEEFSDLVMMMTKAKEGPFHVSGFFPVIGYEEKGVMFDYITGQSIVYDPCRICDSLGYVEKHEISSEYVSEIMHLLDAAAVLRYEESLNRKRQKDFYNSSSENLDNRGYYSMLYVVDNYYLPIYMYNPNKIPNYYVYSSDTYKLYLNFDKKELVKLLDRIRTDVQDGFSLHIKNEREERGSSRVRELL